MGIDYTPPVFGGSVPTATKLNKAFSDVAIALQDAVSQTGSIPNAMENDLDLNGHDLINVGRIGDTLVTTTALNNALAAVQVGSTENIENALASYEPRVTNAEGAITNITSVVSGHGVRITTAESEIDQLQNAIANDFGLYTLPSSAFSPTPEVPFEQTTYDDISTRTYNRAETAIVAANGEPGDSFKYTTPRGIEYLIHVHIGGAVTVTGPDRPEYTDTDLTTSDVTIGFKWEFINASGKRIGQICTATGVIVPDAVEPEIFEQSQVVGLEDAMADLEVASSFSVANVAALLADTRVHARFGTGACIRTREEGFAYKVAATDATDHHLTNAGGVKLYVMPTAYGYNVLAFGAVRDGSTDDSIAFQTAIDYISSIDSGGTLYIPDGQYVVGELVVPGSDDGVVNIEGGQGSTELLRASGADFILEYELDYIRRGGKTLRNIRLNGQDNIGTDTDCIGLRVYAVLQLNAENVFVENCDTAIVVDSIQECVFTNVIASRSRIGWYLLNPNGGLTASQFVRCSAQDNNKVGWIVDGSISSAPAHTLSWDSCLFQVNRFCAFYSKNLAQGHITNAHIEWNGREGSVSETVTVPAYVGGASYTIERSVIHADDETNLEISNSELPESVGSLVMRITNESIISTNAIGGAGLAGADFVRTDASSEFKPSGMLSSFCGGGYYHTWPETLNSEFRGIMYGAPIFRHSSEITNEIVLANGGFSGTLSGATQSTAFDSVCGKCYTLQFLDTVGSSSANRIRATVWTSDTLAAGDKCVFTTLARIASGGVKEIVVDAGGSDYTSATVEITGGGGSGAAATAVLSGGVITGITVTAEGTGYTSTPIISITGDGTGAVCAAIVGSDVAFLQPLSVALTRTIRVTLDWQRVVLWGLNNNATASAQLYIWAADTTAPLLYLSKYQSYRVPISKSQRRRVALLNRIVSEGLVSTAGLSQIELPASATFNPSSLADGAGETTTIAVPGAALGDRVEAAINTNLSGVMLTAWVSATDTVSVRFQNETGGTVDIAVGTLRVWVTKAI